jgi:hypothetical protein
VNQIICSKQRKYTAILLYTPNNVYILILDQQYIHTHFHEVRLYGRGKVSIVKFDSIKKNEKNGEFKIWANTLRDYGQIPHETYHHPPVLIE